MIDDYHNYFNDEINIKNKLNIEIFKNKFPEPHMIYDTDGNLPNPYPGIIGEGEYIITTADSISMCSEAASTGKPIYVFAQKALNLRNIDFLFNNLSTLVS